MSYAQFSNAVPLGDPSERRPGLPAFGAVFQVLSTSLLALRLVSRVRKQGSGPGLDDAFLTIGWAAGTGLTVVFIMGTLQYDFEKHTSAFSPTLALSAAHLAWISEILYVQSSNFIKLGLLFYCRRIIHPNINKLFRWTTLGAIVYVAAYLVSATIVLLVGCRSMEGKWMQLDLKWRASYAISCGRLNIAVGSTGALGVLGDVLAYGITAALMYGMQLPKRQKVGLYAVFVGGLAVVAAAIARSVYLYRTSKTMDVVWDGVSCIISSIAETHLAVICISAPSLRFYLQGFLGPAGDYRIDDMQYGKTDEYPMIPKSDFRGQTNRYGTGWKSGADKLRGAFKLGGRN